MKLYYAPGACSVGIHVLLEEIGKPYQAEAVNFRDGAQYKPPFTGLNPKSKVPTLERDDGSILTEFPVIARWLARRNPQANLIPKDEEADTRAMEVMESSSARSTAKALRGCSAPSASRRRPPTMKRSGSKGANRSTRASPLSTRRWKARAISAAMICRSPTRRCSMSSIGEPSGSDCNCRRIAPRISSA
jgi:glutathione S-transferase